MDELKARRAACTHFLAGDGIVEPARLLAAIPASVEPDVYGDGGVVAELERYVADLLGKPAAVFLPSGTMAQGATLRVHADARTSRVVLWHPQCHLDQHEEQGYARLHDLRARPVGQWERLITIEDLAAVREPVAALLLELPQRDLGGALPAWDDLRRQTDWARDRGVATHLDGARLWEASAGYDRKTAEIAALFDSVYVSFYKGIGALPGCCVAGTEDVVAQVRTWRRRLGGTLYAMWPSAASALHLLPQRVAQMPARMSHARAIASALDPVDGVRVLPDPPQTPMMHLLLHVEAQRYAENARRLAYDEGLWAWPQVSRTADPGVQRAELSIGEATCGLTAQQVADALAVLVS